MANILLVANLNCDRILLLDKPLASGRRYYYRDGGQRLGGGGANTGLGLVWAGHRVALVSQVGRDDIGDWLLAEASTQGLDCHLVQRHPGHTNEMLLMMTPDGERTIIRPRRAALTLPSLPRWQQWDALYINSSAEDTEDWCESAVDHCLVVCQLARDDRPRPCHYLITSASDLVDRCDGNPWDYACRLAGDYLKGFIVTDGARGARLFTRDGQLRVPARPAKVVDTTGAGDVYAAGFMHALLTGMPLATSMETAAVWSAFAVQEASSTPGAALRNYLDAQASDCQTTVIKVP